MVFLFSVFRLSAAVQCNNFPRSGELCKCQSSLKIKMLQCRDCTEERLLIKDLSRSLIVVFLSNAQWNKYSPSEILQYRISKCRVAPTDVYKMSLHQRCQTNSGWPSREEWGTTFLKQKNSVCRDLFYQTLTITT